MIKLPDFPMVAIDSRVVAAYRREQPRCETLIVLRHSSSLTVY
jgi:hypothetical protein